MADISSSRGGGGEGEGGGGGKCFGLVPNQVKASERANNITVKSTVGNL